MYHHNVIPSLWNKLQIIHLIIDFVVEIETNSLSMISLNEGRFNRLDYIYKLHNDGWSNLDISTHLNDRGILTPTGKKYYPNLVWGTLSKYRKRLERYKKYKVIGVKETVWVELD